MRRILTTIVLVLSLVDTAAAEGSHYNPGVTNIRDFQIPLKSGFWGTMYNYYYQSGRLNDENGNEVNFQGVYPGSGKFTEIDPDVDIYAMTLVLTMAWKDIGGSKLDYAFLIAPTLANNSVANSIVAESEQSSDPITSQFGFGDLFVQPLWVGWSYSDTVTMSLAWGFYAPTGEYDTELAEYPDVGLVRVASLDNIGLGFWTSQVRGAVEWYPIPVNGPAVTLAVTHEVNSKKDDLHITPGQHLTLNWGISQYHAISTPPALGIPAEWQLEYGPLGYDSWQVTTDDGSEHTDHFKDDVHAAGFQLGITNFYRPYGFNFHYLNEFAGEMRLQGHVVSLNIFGYFGGEKYFEQSPAE